MTKANIPAFQLGFSRSCGKKWSTRGECPVSDKSNHTCISAGIPAYELRAKLHVLRSDWYSSSWCRRAKRRHPVNLEPNASPSRKCPVGFAAELSRRSIFTQHLRDASRHCRRGLFSSPKIQSIMSSSPTPSYHLCPDFSIAPPTKGHLDLGTILLSLDVAGVSFPLNLGSLVEIPKDRIFPAPKVEATATDQAQPPPATTDDDFNVEGWDMKGGFTRTMGQLRKLDTSIWVKIAHGIGGKLGWLSERSADETLTVKKVLTKYFVPTNEYLEEALNATNVADFITETEKKKPVYMITGLKVAVGASLSKAKSKSTGPGAELGVQDPQSGAGGGGTASYVSKDTENVGFENSSDFVLGLRVRKISWKAGVRKTTDDVRGATLEEGDRDEGNGIMEGVVVVDDFIADEPEGAKGKVFVNEEEDSGVESSIWVLP